jgi:hypothetical protein
VNNSKQLGRIGLSANRIKKFLKERVREHLKEVFFNLKKRNQRK